ncbi:MAG: mannose-1-phosphate guanylyltransferase [Balneolaceae bacterium]
MVYSVIMAGGSGTRFWPKSTKKVPKQFLNLFGDRTMIQATYDRLADYLPQEQCVVVTHNRYVETVRNQLPGVDSSLIIGEPVAKNTAPCVAASAAILAARDPEAVMIVLPADHVIADEASFLKVLKKAVQAAVENHSLVTIGITPDRPETGYGYIRFNDSDFEAEGSPGVYEVEEFTEKPDLESARSFIKSGNYLWNSGMFVWKAEAILKAFEEYQPSVYKSLWNLKKDPVTERDIKKFYQSCPSISIDYGIMEKAENVQVVPGEFGWNDVGSWKAVYDLARKDSDENAAEAEYSCLFDSKGNYIQSAGGKMIALVGVENLAVVETDTSLLVCNLDKSQDVKNVVEYLQKQEKLKKFL